MSPQAPEALRLAAEAHTVLHRMDFGAFHEPKALASPAIAVAFRGAGGFVRSVTATSSEAGPSPMSLLAVTLTANDPPVRPVMSQASSGAFTTQPNPPSR